MNNTKKHIRKIIFRIIIIVITSLLYIFACLWFYMLAKNSDKIIKQTLTTYVNKTSNNQLTLQYDSLCIDIASRELSLHNFSINPVSENSDSTKSKHKIAGKQITFSQISLYSILIENRFKAALLTFDTPQININNQNIIKPDSLFTNTIEQGDVVDIPLFREIFFDTIRITNANVYFDTLAKGANQLPQIYIEAKHFKLGGEKYTDTPYPFDVSDISLVVDNIHQTMPDSLHTISIKQIKMSLIEKTIAAYNAQLVPINNNVFSENLFRVDMPEIILQSDMVEKLLQNDSIEINQLILKNPNIEIKFGTNVEKGTPINEINLHKLVENKLKNIRINQFSVLQSNLKLFPALSDSAAQKIQNLDMHFYHFESNALSYRDTSLFMSAENAELTMEKFTLYHADNIHKLAIDNISASTITKKIMTDSIRFEPISNANTNDASTLIYTKTPKIIFDGVDFKEFYHHKILPMKSFEIVSSNTLLKIKQQLIQQSETKDKSIILEKTRDYLQGIYIDKTHIQNSSLEYTYLTDEDKSGFFTTNFSLSLSDLSIDSVTFYRSDKIFFAQSFQMKLLETTLQLADNKHHLLVDSLNLSSLGQMADIYQMSIVPINPNKKNTDYFEIYFPHIQLSGANLHQAFFNKQLYISDFIVYKPLININKIGKWETNKNIATNYQTDIYNMMSDYIRKLTIRKLTLNSGVLKLLQSNSDKSNFELSNEFSIDMYNFEIDKNSEQRKNKLFFSDNIDLVLKDHSFTLADGVHKIFAKEIGILSSDKKVYMNNANLYPDIQSKNFENMYISIIANIPNVEINQANIFDLFTNGSLSVQNIHVNNPSIKLLFRNENEKKKKSKPKNTKPKMIIENFESIRAKNIIINNGLLELARSKNKQSVPFANAHIDFMIENVSVTQNEGHFDFNYKNFESKLKDLTFDLPDNIHTVKIGNINYSLQQKELLLQQASIAPSKNYPANEKKLFFDIKIPDIKIGNFDFEEYLNNKTLDIGTLTANKPSVKIEDKRIENTQNKKFSPYKMQLFGTVESFAKHVKAKKININEASFSLNNTKNLSLSNIDIEGTAFRIDKYESSENRLLNCDNVRLSVSDIKKPLGTNGHYTYSIDKMILYSDGRFDIHNANLKPTISRDEYAKIKKYQTDYFTISNAHFSGNDFNLNEFIENQSVIIGNLTADFDRVTIHRNKTYPLHPDQKPPMPQEAIRKAKLKMQIKQASITSNYFEYTELEPEAIDTSMVFFTNLRADISNINNIQVEKNEQMPALIQAMLMGQGKMIINSTWDLHSFDNKFTMNAQCYQIPLKTLNPITEPGLKLSIREGLNQKLEASFTANNDSSVGTMKFAYNDLKVSILNHKNGKIREGKFISFLVNTVALRSDNPRKGRILMPVKFKFYRDKQRSVVGYCWRSVYAGIQATLGIKEKETKPEDEIKKPDNE